VSVRDNLSFCNFVCEDVAVVIQELERLMCSMYTEEQKQLLFW